MRPSLVSGMLAMIAGNLHRGVDDVRLFELGHVFSGDTEKVDQRSALAIGLAGHAPAAGPSHPERMLDFYDLKGLVEQLVACFKARSFYVDSFPPETGLTPGWLHPYRAARVAVDGLTVGWFGQVHPGQAAAHKLKEVVFAGELYLDRLFALPAAKPVVRELSRFQPVRRDFSLFVPSSVLWSQIDAALAGSAPPDLVDWKAREVRRADIPTHSSDRETYSLLLGATFQAANRTLREEELQSLSQYVIEAVAPLGVRLRS
jgi:phenylalanyl-tRNA synthetase beta chain